MLCRSSNALAAGVIAVTITALIGCASVAKLTGGVSPPAPIDNPGMINLPMTFESVWYRPVERGMSLKAYSASGTLVVGEDVIDFRGGDNSVRIPISDIRTIAWGKVGQDIWNDWAIVEFVEGDKSTGVCFKDGSRLGHGGDSDLIYAVIKYAAVVRGGVEPNPESFYSGWVDAHGGGVTGIDGKPNLTISLSNHAGVPVWVKVTFSIPRPAEACEETARLSPDQNKAFVCPQHRIHADSIYSIHVDVYIDEDLQNIVDRNKLEHIWSQHEVAAFKKALIETKE